MNSRQIEALHAEHSAALRRFLLGVLRDADLADEALQQTFVRLLEQGDQAQTETMQGWIYRVAFHEAMALRRRQKLDARAARAIAFDPALLTLAAPGLATDEAAVIDEDLRRATAALAELPDAQREIVRLRFSESQTFAQIAAHLNVPLGTALTRMRLALTKLRGILR